VLHHRQGPIPGPHHADASRLISHWRRPRFSAPPSPGVTPAPWSCAACSGRSN